MLGNFLGFPHFVTIDDGLDDIYSDVLDVIQLNPFYHFDGLPLLSERNRRKKSGSKKFTISIDVGRHYQLKDISTSFEGRKLKVVGQAVENLKNGTNTHNFERLYDIPEDVLIDTLTKKMSSNGSLHLIFDKQVVVPKSQFEDASTDEEFKIRLNLPDYTPQDIAISVVGQTLKIEASKKSQATNNDSGLHSSYCGYLSRVLTLPDDVVMENLNASVATDGAYEISAPRDKNRLKCEPRRLDIKA